VSDFPDKSGFPLRSNGCQKTQLIIILKERIAYINPQIAADEYGKNVLLHIQVLTVISFKKNAGFFKIRRLIFL
jgi:hypothetical protein